MGTEFFNGVNSSFDDVVKIDAWMTLDGNEASFSAAFMSGWSECYEVSIKN